MAGSPESRPQLQIAPFIMPRDGIPSLQFPYRQIHDKAVFQPLENVSFNPAGKTIVSFINNKERKAEAPDILSVAWVQQAVVAERQKPLPPGKTPWYHLPGTGFWMEDQAARLMKDVHYDGVDSALLRAREDFNAYEREYLKQMVSLRWNLAVGIVAGKQRIICSDYDNASLESVTSRKERHGIVYDTLFGDKKRGIAGVEEQILSAPTGTMAIIVSPEGWSGLLDADGKEIRYPEAQIYGILKKQDGTLQAYTFRSKANILQNEAFQRSLGLKTPAIRDQKERIKSVFSNVAIITPGEADWAEMEGRKPVRGFEDVVDLIQKSVGGREEAYEGKTFDDMRAYLRHPERFEHKHPLTDQLIQRFEEYAKWRLKQGGKYEDIVTDLKIALAFNPTQLGLLYREEKEVKVVDDGKGLSLSLAKQRLRYMEQRGGINYQEEAQRLQELPGCAGGGGTTSVFSLGGRRKGKIEGNSGGGEDYGFDHKGTCVNCGMNDEWLGPCDICIPCDAGMGGKASKEMALAA